MPDRRPGATLEWMTGRARPGEMAMETKRSLPPVLSLPNRCPACGPVATQSTSRYCLHHLATMRTTWQAARGRDERWRPAA